ncbi:hypothetical protein OOK13_14455 [Streptomyces sp. NBC_00378]|uniref:hypothetical protein n=1 Tax=unclassified Streptomyces TaxID=2593676 RepID=UPI002256D54D|nr:MULTISPECIES: hypothetical protein [unclassified Streptomyces]MCX5109720.1 hypothetical protein [Streptomyces sp. NBC_00378]
MRKRLGGAVVGAALMTMIGLSGTAHADDGECLSATGGKVCFYHYGDYFTVYDTAKDSAHPEAPWWLQGGRMDTCKNLEGYQSQVTCNYDFPEHQLIAFNLQIWDGNKMLRNTPSHRTCTSEAGGFCS